MPRNLPAALLALAALTSGCTAAHAPSAEPSAPAAGLEVSVDEAFYGVGGVTALELNRELFRRGPMHAGVRWQGLTDFRVVYSYFPARAADGCRAAAPKVRVEVVTTLPRWKHRDEAPEWLRSDWDLFLTRLRRHEEGHQRIAIGAGRALLEDVAALEAPDCETLRRTAAAMADAYRASVAREQRTWDEETGHGLAGDS